MLSMKHRIVRVICTFIIFLAFCWAFVLGEKGDSSHIFSRYKDPSFQSKIAKVSVALNDLNSTTVSRALKSHAVQNKLHGYRHFIDTAPLVIEDKDPQGRPLGTWNKPAYLLSIIFEELKKSENERLEWLFWFDADTIVLNPYVALETFLPPNTYGLKDIHLLVTENWDGINAGVFPIRVHPWSVALLSACIAYPTFHPREWLQFRDQSALQRILEEYPAFKLNWAIVPHRWFNSFPINSAFSDNGTWIYATAMTPEEFDDGEEVNDGQPWKVLKGDMIVHFAGAKLRQSWMEPWADRAEMYLPEWSDSLYQKVRRDEATRFWKKEKLRIAQAKQDEYERMEQMQNQNETLDAWNTDGQTGNKLPNRDQVGPE